MASKDWVDGYMAVLREAGKPRGLERVALLTELGEDGAHMLYANPYTLDGALPGRTPISNHLSYGTVYVLYDDAGQRYKIGFTTGPVQRRRRAIETAADLTLSVVAEVPGTMADERALHERFAGQRIAGEWFAASSELHEWITYMREEATA